MELIWRDTQTKLFASGKYFCLNHNRIFVWCIIYNILLRYVSVSRPCLIRESTDWVSWNFLSSLSNELLKDILSWSWMTMYCGIWLDRIALKIVDNIGKSVLVTLSKTTITIEVTRKAFNSRNTDGYWDNTSNTCVETSSETEIRQGYGKICTGCSHHNGHRLGADWTRELSVDLSVQGWCRNSHGCYVTVCSVIWEYIWHVGCTGDREWNGEDKRQRFGFDRQLECHLTRGIGGRDVLGCSSWGAHLRRVQRVNSPRPLRHCDLSVSSPSWYHMLLKFIHNIAIMKLLELIFKNIFNS